MEYHITRRLNCAGYTSDVGATVHGIELDHSGNVVLAGQSLFPSPYPAGHEFLTPGLTTEPGPASAAFVLRLNVGSVPSSTLIGGEPVAQTGAQNTANAVATGTDGSIYITGEAIGTGFPTTQGAFQQAKDGYFAFVVKLNPDASAITWATLLEGTTPVCEGLNCPNISRQPVTSWLPARRPTLPSLLPAARRRRPPIL